MFSSSKRSLRRSNQGKLWRTRLIFLALGLLIAYHLYGSWSIESPGTASEELGNNGVGDVANMGAATEHTVGCMQKDHVDAQVMDLIELWDDKRHAKDREIITCIIFTTDAKHDHAKTSKSTWTSKCDHRVFISNADDPSIPAIKSWQLAEDNRENFHEKVKWAFRYAYDAFPDTDWFVKADDDAFFIMENLRQLLHNIDAKDRDRPHYLGRRIVSTVTPFAFNSGGAGYVLNKVAMQMILDKGLRDGVCAMQRWKFANAPEDTFFGWCLRELNVYPEDTSDDKKRERFHFLNPAMHMHLVPKPGDWYFDFIKDFPIPNIYGPNYFSPSTISFHYLDDSKHGLRLYNYLYFCRKGKNPPF